jgi:hypothetical protein
MAAAGWPPLSLHGLPVAYAKDQLVTPYFCCYDIEKRPYGAYAIEGLFGVIHQEFEEIWRTHPDHDPEYEPFAMGLYIANFRDLDWILSDDPSSNDIAIFCDAVVRILNDFPSDEIQLVTALESNAVHGFKFEAFIGVSNRSKFAALVEFLRQRGRTLRN